MISSSWKNFENGVSEGVLGICYCHSGQEKQCSLMLPLIRFNDFENVRLMAPFIAARN